MASTITALEILGADPLPDGADAAIPNGWAVKATLPYDGAATFDPTKIVLTVEDPGFTNTGAVTTVTRIIRGGAIIRKQYPNQATLLAADVGGNLEVYFSLQDDIYEGSTIAGAEAESGYYGDDAAGTIAGVVNGSVLQYPLPGITWINFHGEVAQGTSYAVEAYCAHRHARNGQQVACVQFIASDSQGVPNVAATQLQGTPSLSDLQTQGNIAEVYKASIPLTALTQGDLCQVNAKVFPWIGDSTAVLDLDVHGVAWPTVDPWTKLRFVCDKDGSYGGACAVVKAGASGGSVQATLAAARATPFPSPSAAMLALPAWNNANRARNNHSGSFVYLQDDGAGGAVEHEPGGNLNPAAGDGLTRIMQDPTNTATASLKLDVSNRAVSSHICFMVDLRQGAGGQLFDGGASQTNMTCWDGVGWTQTGANNPATYRQMAWTRNGTDLAPVGVFAATHMVGHTSVQDNQANLIAPVIVGCNFKRKVLFTNSVTPQYEDGAIRANNEFLDCRAANGMLGATGDMVRGSWIIQNVMERDIIANPAAFTCGGDGTTRAAKNVVLMHNTIVGDRLNLCYADVAGAVGVQKEMTSRFNLIEQRNTKSDTFDTNTTNTGRTGNWRYRYGVGNDDVVFTGGGESPNTGPGLGKWIGEYWPKPDNAHVNRANVPFVDDRSFHGTNTGGGDYHLSGTGNGANAAYAKVPAEHAGLRYDLSGIRRLLDGQGAAGAFERTDVSTIPGNAEIELSGATVAGGGTSVVEGDGTVSLAPATVSAGGDSTEIVEGDGVISLAPATVDATGDIREVTMGDAVISLGGVSVAATGAAVLDVGTGPIIAGIERSVTVLRIAPGGSGGASLPLGAYRWASPFDPSDRAPYAILWNELLEDGEEVAELVQLTMSAEGASLGVQIDTSTGRGPIIGEDGKSIQIWFRCTDPENPAFSGAGVAIGIAALIRTSADPFKQFERTAVLTVRQQ